MEPRMTHPARQVPGAMKAILALSEAAKGQGVDDQTLELVHLRTSQINRCELCIQLHVNQAEQTGFPYSMEEVEGWLQSDRFSDAERAALALAEAATRIADRDDPVSDELWAEATAHYSEPQLSAILVQIAAVNVWNRLNATTRQDMSAFAPA